MRKHFPKSDVEWMEGGCQVEADNAGEVKIPVCLGCAQQVNAVTSRWRRLHLKQEGNGIRSHNPHLKLGESRIDLHNCLQARTDRYSFGVGCHGLKHPNCSVLKLALDKVDPFGEDAHDRSRAT